MDRWTDKQTNSQPKSTLLCLCCTRLLARSIVPCSTEAPHPPLPPSAPVFHVPQNKPFLAMAFPKLERYVQWDRASRAGPDQAIKYLLRWSSAGEAGMDHEENFCPGSSYWDKDNPANPCPQTNHYGLDFANYIIWECAALAKVYAVTTTQTVSHVYAACLWWRWRWWQWH